MRAATIRGGPFRPTITVGDAPKPTPGPHDVLVQVHASSVNPKDWKLNVKLSSIASSFRSQGPFLLGDDLSGIVVETGNEVTEFEVGDAVYGMDMRLRTASCAEYAVIASRRVAHKPDTLSHAEAAVVPLAALTAYQAFVMGDVSAGTRLLLIGASGGVGTFGVQIAKAMGAHVTGVCSHRNIELVRSLGADHVIDYTAGDYLADPKFEDQFDVIFDATSYESPSRCSRALTPRGVFITTSGYAKAIASVWASRCRPGSQRAMSVWVESHTQDLDVLRAWLDNGSLRPVIDSAFGLEELGAAYERSQTGRARGKIAIRVVE